MDPSTRPTPDAIGPDLLALEAADFVQAAYRTVLAREPDPQGFMDCLERLATGTSRRQLIEDLQASAEGQLRRNASLPLLDGLGAAALPEPPRGDGALHQLLQREGSDFVAHAYVLLLGRQADPMGLAHYSARLAQGISRRQIVAELGCSDEFARRNREVPGLAAIVTRHRRLQHPIARAAARLVRRLQAGTAAPSAGTPPRAGGTAAAAASPRVAAPAPAAAPTAPAPSPQCSDPDPGDDVGAASATTSPAARPVLAERQWLLTLPPLEARDGWRPI